MVNPVTVNAGIIVPLTGADVDTWGEDDVNPNMVAIDGMLCGVQTVAVVASPITLSTPTDFVATPSPGPTQSQNRVLRFTGAMGADVRITLPIPGVFVIDNKTTGNYVLSFQGITATEVIAVEQGAVVEIYNDGANVRFINLGKVGAVEFWGGITAMPAWVAACTVKPYLYSDGTVYNFADYPYLGARYVGSFGGNGVTTFAVQDLRGRYPLAYDGTGTRVTVAESGLNGATMGAVLNAQSVTLTSNMMPIHYHAAGIYDPQHFHNVTVPTFVGNVGGGGAFGNNPASSNTAYAATGVRVNSSNGLDTTYSAGGGLSHPNMPNTQVAGIWVVKT